MALWDGNKEKTISFRDGRLITDNAETEFFYSYDSIMATSEEEIYVDWSVIQRKGWIKNKMALKRLRDEKANGGLVRWRTVPSSAGPNRRPHYEYCLADLERRYGTKPTLPTNTEPEDHEPDQTESDLSEPSLSPSVSDDDLEPYIIGYWRIGLGARNRLGRNVVTKRSIEFGKFLQRELIRRLYPSVNRMIGDFKGETLTDGTDPIESRSRLVSLLRLEPKPSMIVIVEPERFFGSTSYGTGAAFVLSFFLRERGIRVVSLFPSLDYISVLKVSPLPRELIRCERLEGTDPTNFFRSSSASSSTGSSLRPDSISDAHRSLFERLRDEFLHRQPSDTPPSAFRSTRRRRP